ncbi:MAG: M48 family metallopeptidase [Burkholderiales bacterium]
MNSVLARYFDGKSSDGREVVLELDAQGVLHLRGGGSELTWPLAQVRASERIGSSRRRLYFPDGSQCETGDNDGVDAMLGAQAPAASRLLARWEGGLRYAIAALVVTLLAAAAVVFWGVPALAKQVAFALPAQTERLIGGDALAALDRVVFKPSALPAERQEALRKLHARMAAETGSAGEGRLELRRGGRAGANALALPAHLIVLTDELVALAKDDREIEAVLAHEFGHQRERHILRHVLQDSIAALLVAVTVGDLSSLTSLAAAAPTLLLQMKFSRDFEREADDFALDYLKRRGIPPEVFVAMLERLEASRPGGSGGPDFLSTHPEIRVRIERARGAR